jgi:hypothetical protein
MEANTGLFFKDKLNCFDIIVLAPYFLPPFFAELLDRPKDLNIKV